MLEDLCNELEFLRGGGFVRGHSYLGNDEGEVLESGIRGDDVRNSRSCFGVHSAVKFAL